MIHDIIRREFHAQGHTLTGEGARSLEGRISSSIRTHTLSGFALAYVKTVDEGLKPNQISWKMYDGLLRYFILRRLDQQNAKQAAAATIKKWMSEGMSTQASKRFSKTGARQNFLEAAFLYPQIDEYMENSFDFAVEEEYRKTKSETI